MSSELELSEFLKYFPPVSLHHRQPESFIYPWVFWSKSEGCENGSSSADLDNPKIHDKIKSALSNAEYSWGFLGQFWAPVTLDGIWVLSTSGQPFAIRRLSNKFAMYRLYSEKRKYNIDDANKLDVKPGHMIISGGPATAFLNCRTHMNKFPGFLSESDYYGALNFSVMVPICLPSQSNCIGVLEFTLDHLECELASFLFRTVKTIKKAGLDVFYVQDLIPYKTIDGLEVTKDEIEEALKVICGSHNLALAQVWISYEDKRIVPFTYSWEDSQTPKRLLAIKLTGYLCAGDFEQYFRFGDVTPCANIEELPLVTLHDYESRYISSLHSEMLVGCHLKLLHLPRALAICLRSHETSDFNYVFEFMWTKHSNHVTFLEAILLTLKRCLPRFKFASGTELGDELNVIDVENSTDDITEKFKIFQGKRLSLMPEARDEAKKTMVVDYIAPSEVTCKTTVKVLPREVIEKQFGKTMKDAAKNLNENGLDLDWSMMIWIGYV